MVSHTELLDPVRLEVCFRRPELLEAVADSKRDMVEPHLILLGRRSAGTDFEECQVVVILTCR